MNGRQPVGSAPEARSRPTITMRDGGGGENTEHTSRARYRHVIQLVTSKTSKHKNQYLIFLKERHILMRKEKA